jgi:hypothetical protein
MTAGQGGDRLARFLQPPTARERAALSARQPTLPVQGFSLPARIGPAEFSMLGNLVAVRCPVELEPLVQKAGGIWEPGSKRWLVERRHLGPLIRDLRRSTDPPFRRGGIDLDREGQGA